MPPQLNALQRMLESEIKKQKFGREPTSLYEPIRYLMGLGGKRLRPMLTLLAYSLYKNDYKRVVPYAAAVEAFHNFTLMHDDIMDNAPLRRGKQTVHEKWNVNTAILAGDVMLVKVYDMLIPLGDQLPDILRTFNKCAAEVCEGQQWDMEFEGRRNVTEAEYINMIRLKTAVLLGFSLEFGAMLAGASVADRNALRNFGTKIGIGFQLADDLLDAYADPKKFGKQVGGDILANKKTFLLIKALERAKGKDRKALHSWLALKSFSKSKKIQAIKDIYGRADIGAITEKKINHFFKGGFKHLEELSASREKLMLLQTYCKSLMQRQS
ncbi:MAG TPA: polyprenyl synthetase family protein [Chryseosolibacter sp.]|nr:polyprenyl synthetase family protein [Chryseosolibacter sp.]